MHGAVGSRRHATLLPDSGGVGSPVFVQRFGLAIGALDDGFVVMDLDGRQHFLNGSALFVLDCCATPQTADDILEAIRLAYGTEAVAGDVVEACLADLFDRGLLREHRGVPPQEQPTTRDLRVAPSDAVGRGVFAVRDFAAGETIERCAVLVLGAQEAAAVLGTALGRYVFQWSSPGVAIALGFGSLYNHSDAPNARWQALLEDYLIEFSAIVDIAAGSEVLIDYSGGSGAQLGYRALPSEP